MARFAGAAKASAILRLPNQRKLATLVAFVHCLEAAAQDDALAVLEGLLREVFNGAIRADKKARLRTMKDLDHAAITLARACQHLLDDEFPDAELRAKLFEQIPRDMLTRAVESVKALTRPANDVYLKELNAKYKTIRFFLPTLVDTINFTSNAVGDPLIAALW